MLCQSELSEVLAIFLLNSAGNVSGVPSFFESSKMERVQLVKVEQTGYRKKGVRIDYIRNFRYSNILVLFSVIHLYWRSLSLQTNVKY